MNIDQLKALRDSAAGGKVKALDIRDRYLHEVQKLDTPDAKKKYTGAYVFNEKLRLKRQAAADMRALIEKQRSNREAMPAAAKAWSVESKMAAARFVPQKLVNGVPDVAVEQLEEMRHARARDDIRHAADSELPEMLRSAVEGQDFALLHLLQKDIGRRKWTDETARVQAKVGLTKALKEIQIPGGDEANKLLESAAFDFEFTEDLCAEIEIGRKPVSIQMAEAFARQAIQPAA